MARMEIKLHILVHYGRAHALLVSSRDVLKSEVKQARTTAAPLSQSAKSLQARGHIAACNGVEMLAYLMATATWPTAITNKLRRNRYETNHPA